MDNAKRQKSILIAFSVLFIFFISLVRVSYVCASNLGEYYKLAEGHEKNYYAQFEEDEPELPVDLTPVVVELPEIQEIALPYTDEEVELLTNTLYGEARGIKSKMQKSAVVWCVLNRVDAGYGTIKEVVTAPNQFCGYVKNRTYGELDCYNECKEIVIDVLNRYFSEEQIGRTLPKNYLYFRGVKGVNVFRDKFNGNYTVWDWSLPDPYENEDM